jgi:uncharacterized protein YecA (UPF0149 family)
MKKFTYNDQKALGKMQQPLQQEMKGFVTEAYSKEGSFNPERAWAKETSANAQGAAS